MLFSFANKVANTIRTIISGYLDLHSSLSSTDCLNCTYVQKLADMEAQCLYISGYLYGCFVWSYNGAIEPGPLRGLLGPGEFLILGP